jgi:magnesium-transporting ATPase (P-type)
MSVKKSIFLSTNLWFVIIIILIVLVSLSISKSISVDDYIPEGNASSIISTIIDLYVALLGFWGIILVYLLTTLREAKQSIMRQKFEVEMAELKLEAESLGGKNPKAIPRMGIFLEKYKNRTNQIDEEFKQLVIQTFSVSVAAIVIVAYLFAGIFASIHTIGLITEKGLYFFDFFWILLLLFAAFLGIFVVIIFTSPKYEREILEQELKRSWEQAKQKRKS